MPWKKLGTKSRTTYKVTIRNNAVAFSAFFIRIEQLIHKKYVEILEDPEISRIGFRFLEKPPHYNALALHQDGGKKGERNGLGKVVFTNLKEHLWIKDALEMIEGQKSFIIQKDQGVNDALYFIELSFPYSGIKQIENYEITQGASGVYRLIGERMDILRIGEGENIKSRLVSHLKKPSISAISYFDFFVVNDEKERKKEEQRLFADYKRTHANHLPPLNSITA